jgi:hypothetical protein
LLRGVEFGIVEEDPEVAELADVEEISGEGAAVTVISLVNVVVPVVENVVVFLELAKSEGRVTFLEVGVGWAMHSNCVPLPNGTLGVLERSREVWVVRDSCWSRLVISVAIGEFSTESGSDVGVVGAKDMKI